MPVAIPSTSWIILTMGDRPEDVAAAVSSVRAQTLAPTEILVLGNGTDPGTIEGATSMHLAENLGISAGRNVGAEAATGDLLFFLDDDAVCAGPDVAARVVEFLHRRADVAAVAMRIIDPVTSTSQRRHVPRLRGGDPLRSSDVTAFLGGACAVWSADFERVGGYAPEFFYSMEETDLAWRLLDGGRAIHYLATAEVNHPATTPARHGRAFVLTARNRVWTAHRRLPLPLAGIYLAIWSVLMLIRAPTMAARRDTLIGLLAGFRTPTPRPIDPMSWRTAVRMSRLGRPPVI